VRERERGEKREERREKNEVSLVTPSYRIGKEALELSNAFRQKNKLPPLKVEQQREERREERRERGRERGREREREGGREREAREKSLLLFLSSLSSGINLCVISE
jgi:hypothetical protein